MITISAQQIVIKWIEYAGAGAVVLVAARIALGRLRQPADRINLILMSFLAAAIIPVVVSFAHVPGWHLGLVAAPGSENRPSASVPSKAPLAEAPPFQTAGSGEFEFPPVSTAEGEPRPDIGHSGITPVAPSSRKLKLDVWELAAAGLLAAHGLAIVWFAAEWIVGVRWLRCMAARSVLAGPAVRAVWSSVTAGAGDAVRLLVSSEISTPLTYSCRRPTVVVPDSITCGDGTVLRYCLAHEWSHVARGDLAVWRLTCFCQFALWFQPLFWLLRRELQACQDFVADHRAAGAGREAIEYSELLLELSRQRMGRPVVGAISLLDRSSQLSRRIKMLLASPIALRSSSPLIFYLAAGTLSLACAVLISTLRIGAAEADEAQREATAIEQARPNQPAAAEEAQPTSPLHYTGIVLDKETGKGIPNATVVVRRSKYTVQKNSILAETRHKTDAEGKYSFEIPPEQAAVPEFYIGLDVKHDDYVAEEFGNFLATVRKNETLGERPFFEKVKLEPSDPITGNIVDADGKPLSGVFIKGYSKASATDSRDHGSFTNTKTDKAGRFRLSLIKGGVGVFWVMPAEYASTSRAVSKQHGDVGEIRLRQGVRVAGRVLSVEGQPMPGVPVSIQYEGGGNEALNDPPVASSIRRSCLTDREGHFAFEPLPNGKYRVSPTEIHDDAVAGHRTYHELSGVFLPTTVNLQEGVACPAVEIQAVPHVIVHAQTLDSKGAKKGGAGFSIAGWFDGQFWAGQGVPNSEGTISARVPHGLQKVEILFPTTAHQATRIRRGKNKELEQGTFGVQLGTLNDDVEGFEIIYYRAPTVLLSAVDADGKPVKDFRVAATVPGGKQLYILEGEQSSDISFKRREDGSYRTQDMLPDEDVKFTITAAGYAPASETVRLGEGQTKQIVLALKSTGDAAEHKAGKSAALHYTCVVLDKETGKGIPNATVVVRRSKSTSQEKTLLEETQHTTDAEGKYSFEIPPEQVAVSSLYIELDVEHDDYAARKGFGYALSMIRKNETLGERPFFEKVELQPSDPITGIVVDPNGKPLGGVYLQGYSKASSTDFREYGSFTNTTTDDAGRFRLNLIKGGVGVFWVLPTEYASTSRAVNKERGDVGEIRSRPGVRVSGRVLSVEGKPVPHVPVNIQYKGGGNETVNDLPVATSIRRSAITDDNGKFAFGPLPSGEYRVIPEEHHYDAIIRDRKRYDVPGVFLPVKITLQEGVACAPIEIQESPHVLFNAQYLDSKGNKTRGHEVLVFGRMDGQYWFGQGRPSSEGTISMPIPHGLQNVQLNLMTNEHGALRFRRGKGKELENNKSRVEMGTLNDDVEGFEIIRYLAPITLVNAVDEDGKQVQGFRVTAAYPWGDQRYILAGEMRSDLNFERQDDGRYRTTHMLPDEDVKFTVTAPGYEPASETVRLGEGQTKELTLALKKAVEQKE